jgi:protein-glucosylgalactosylhydroxylysine glucosidase
MLFGMRIMKIKSICLFLSVILTFAFSCTRNPDRHQVVSRNNIENSFINNLNSLSVGNGSLIFTVDITGLQSLPDLYPGAVSLKTLADWGCTNPGIGANSVYFQLCTIGLQIFKENGEEIVMDDILDPIQKLDLWSGEIDSKFNIEGIPVHLKTVCHPDYDLIAVKINSELVGMKRLRIKINFPSDVTVKPGYGYENPDTPANSFLPDTGNLATFSAHYEKKAYDVVFWLNSASVKKVNTKLYYLVPDESDSVYSFSCQFLNDKDKGRIQNFGETETASRVKWEKFWNEPADIDLFGTDKPVTKELERRIILAKYFNRIQKFLYNKK